MDNSDYCPLPPPRNKITNKCTKKKPVPSPRSHVNVDNSVSKDGSSSSTLKEINALFKKHIKPEIKMTSENMLERKKSVIENTRSMSICIEKSFRSLLPRPRRHTISQTSEDFKADRSESPIEDIFSSLSFDSPIQSDSNSDRSFSNYYSEFDFYNSQPPNFPPPPLPQNVLYDKVPNSSNSSSHCGSYSAENIYELILTGQTKSQVNSYENWNLSRERSSSSSDKSNINTETKHRKSVNENVHSTCLLHYENKSNDSKSVVLEFDPLHNSFCNDSDKKEECILLQEIDEILFSQYSTVESKSILNYNDENLDEDLYNTIPEPPTRVDSIQESSSPLEVFADDGNNIDCKEETEIDSNIEEKPRKNSIKNWLSMKRTLKKVADGSSESVRKMKLMLKSEDKVEKENVQEVNHCNIFHNGTLLVSIDEKNKDFDKKWCQIASGQLMYAANKNQTENTINLTSLISIQTIHETKQR